MREGESVFIFHKPKATVVSRHDERNRKTVYDLLPSWVAEEHWIPVARLDRDTRGLLLFVKNSKLMEHLSAPGNFAKEYQVLVRGHVNEDHVAQLISGIETPSGLLRCAAVKDLRYIGPKTRLSMVLSEGKNRQIRRVFGALKDASKGTALKVLDLKRVKFGPVSLDVPSGQWRFLSEAETNELIESVIKF
jgi:23S rRNA pseudouridine2605 synthase